ncbi:hypothetical protein C0989_006790 [Termitomyces sp. Mn162]|nr:hypothetical protein C0989_006790 [Termitomyces sp. Mn162]
MPKHYCDYCDVFLTHDSTSGKVDAITKQYIDPSHLLWNTVRKAHNSGRNHLANVRDYYASLGHDKAQSIIDQITAAYETSGGPPPGGFGFGPQHLVGPPPGYGGPPAGFGGPVPPPGFGGRESILLSISYTLVDTPIARPPFPPGPGFPPMMPPGGPPFPPNGGPPGAAPPGFGGPPPFPPNAAPSGAAPFPPNGGPPGSFPPPPPGALMGGPGGPSVPGGPPPSQAPPQNGSAPPAGSGPSIHPDRLRMLNGR